MQWLQEDNTEFRQKLGGCRDPPAASLGGKNPYQAALASIFLLKQLQTGESLDCVDSKKEKKIRGGREGRKNL